MGWIGFKVNMNLFFPGSGAAKPPSAYAFRWMAIYELDPVDRIAVAAVGEPGQRRFFLLATGSGRTLTLGCEKSQLQALILRLHQMLEAQQIEGPEGADDESPTGQVSGEPEWQIGEMGLGYHEARQMFVLVASQGAVGESTEAPPEDDSPSVRFWLRHDQVIAFSKQAESVLSAGRPLCPRCGLPMDPAGHPCPVMNGARPIF
ncbi:MAG: hypothetical protein AUI83_18050 [Armatimonadetes bacterium 13_1_40CM_3_65_7]|nr:MAG: hypothetical protein AUI83_18050 [Armatimonadetes bacterium 13_1_40CM_3_65_7]